MTDGLRRAEAELRAFIASGFSLSRGAEGVFDHLIFTQVAGSVGFGPRDIVALQRRARRGVQKLQSGEMWELPTRLRYKLSWDANRLSALERRAPGPSASYERVATILGLVGSRLRKFDCGTLYLPLRRQSFCSDPCFEQARRVYNRDRKRAKSDADTEKASKERHERYEKSVRGKRATRSSKLRDGGAELKCER
jgi:hypothetical protein